MRFAKAEGYHSKTLAYSIWHVFRIEDIVLHTLILNNSQVLERGEWQKKIGAEIITINGSRFLPVQGTEISLLRWNYRRLCQYLKVFTNNALVFIICENKC